MSCGDTDVNIRNSLDEVSVGSRPEVPANLQSSAITNASVGGNNDNMNSYYYHSRGEVVVKRGSEGKSALASTAGDFIVPGGVAKTKDVVNTRAIELSGEEILRHYYQYQAEQENRIASQSSTTEFDGLALSSEEVVVSAIERHHSRKSILKKLSYYQHLKQQRKMLAEPEVNAKAISLTEKVFLFFGFPLITVPLYSVLCVCMHI